MEFKRYMNNTSTPGINNRQNMSLPQHESVWASSESKLLETECLTDVYKPGLLYAEQTMWTPLYDSGFVTESSLSITDTDSETYDLIIVQFRSHEFKQFNLDFIKEGGKIL